MLALTLRADMETVARARRFRMAVMRVRVSQLLVPALQRGVRGDDGGLGGARDAVLGGPLVLEDDMFDTVGPGGGAGEGGARQRVAVLVGLDFALAGRHGGPTAAATGSVARAVLREEPAGAHSLHEASEERVDHGDVPDHDGHEGLADGPAAGLFGAVCAGLFKHGLLVW